MGKKRIPSNLRNEKYCVGIITDSLRSGLVPIETDKGYIADVARKHGANPEAGYYYPQLARFPGDPEAFVSSRSEIRRVLESRGWSSRGIVEVESKGPDRDPEPYRPADDIIDREVAAHMEREGPPKDVGELRSEITKRLSGNESTTPD